jgi:PAS domain S-box-containing protein
MRLSDDCNHSALAHSLSMDDLSWRRYTTAELKILRQVMARCRQAVVITDANNVIQDVNDAYVAMTGFSREDAIGNTPRIGKSDRHDSAFYAGMWASIERDNYWEGEIWDRRHNGEAYLKHLSISRLFDDDGQVANYLAMFEDLTEQKALESELDRRMHYDSLTGLANKVLFNNRLEHEFSVAERHKRNVGLVLLNLDRFRKVNESLGYLVGDRLLQAVAARLADNIRKTDLIARDSDNDERPADTISRFGGDQFTFILADLAVPENAAVATRRLLESFRQPYVIDGQELFLSASIGIAVWPHNATTLDGMMNCVEKALEDAREAGGNTFRFFSAAMNQASTDRFLLESEMRKALAGGGFKLAYQPKIDLATGLISGVEALVRWQRDDGRMASPAEFIPIAEETSLILPLGEWILETACRDIHSLNQRFGRQISVAVNLSARQFQYGKVPQLIDRVLAATGLPAHLLELEITESMVMRDVIEVIAILQDIRKRGIGLAIDDFGTGYSSLAYLKSFPIRTLKIDRSFVLDLERNPDAGTICDITVLLAHKLGMNVVAEGVETREQLKFLLSIGCETIQGYLFSKPLFLADLESFILAHRPLPGLGTTELWPSSAD